MSFALIFMHLKVLDDFLRYSLMAVFIINLVCYFLILKLNCGDKYIFLISALLVSIGLIMLLRLKIDFGRRQIIWYGIGMVVFAICYFCFKYKDLWRNLQWVYFWTGFALLVATQLIGTIENGAKNWLYIGNVSFQPSEAIKILYALFIACYLYKQNKQVYYGVPEKWVIAICTYVYCIFFILQKEWGTTVLLFATYLIMIFIQGSNWSVLLLNMFGIGFVASQAYSRMDYIKVRIQNWIDPWANVYTTGYQMVQAQAAIAVGGFFGTGFGKGGIYIPEVHSDFIFAAICEEFGILGGCAIILLFLILIYRGFKIALLARGFEKWLACCVTVIFALQTFIIIGGVTKLIPLTGITLPFISAGGSSMLTTFAAIGILQGISARKT